MFYNTFNSPIGIIAIVWNEKGVVGLNLPEKTSSELIKKVKTRFKDAKKIDISCLVRKIVNRLNAHLSGCNDDLKDILIDIKGTDFQRKLYKTLRNIKPGKTISYGKLAEKCGLKMGARAVGTAMRKNPIPLIIPCHRVIKSNGELGNFSSYEGSKLKKYLIEKELE